jgi:tRNA G18 (ribose-2'-O)-methylase SpoU
MTAFEVRQCTNKDCQLRLPIDPQVNQGLYCPRCGAPIDPVIVGYENFAPKPVQPGRRRSFELVLDNIRSAYNVGAIFRTADAVGVQQIYLCGITPEPESNAAIHKTALGAEAVLPWQYHPNGWLLAKDLKAKGYRLLALECTPKAESIENFRLDPHDTSKIVLILGNERSGVDPGIIELCDAVLCLPMAGEKKSLNVAVAFGAAAYWLSYV